MARLKVFLFGVIAFLTLASAVPAVAGAQEYHRRYHRPPPRHYHHRHVYYRHGHRYYR